MKFQNGNSKFENSVRFAYVALGIGKIAQAGTKSLGHTMSLLLRNATLTFALSIASAASGLMLTPNVANAEWVNCAKELGLCRSTQNWAQDFRFGTAGKYIYKRGVKGDMRCDRASFKGDPKPNRRKHCQIWRYNWKKCASELGLCKLPSHIKNGTTVRFGTTPHDKRRFHGTFVKGSIRCDRPSFRNDPHPHRRKSCWYWNTPR